MLTFKEFKQSLIEAKSLEQVLMDVEHKIVTFDKPSTGKIKQIKVINAMKEKRNKIKDPKIYLQYQIFIDKLELDYRTPTVENNKDIITKVIAPVFSTLSAKEKRRLLMGALDKLYALDKVYYSGIKIEEIESLVDTEFVAMSASSIKEMFFNIKTKCIVQDFGIKQRRILGIESDNEVKSKLLSVTKEIGQSRIVLSTNYGLRLMKDAFDELSRIYK
jgi:hypothetical protein